MSANLAGTRVVWTRPHLSTNCLPTKRDTQEPELSTPVRPMSANLERHTVTNCAQLCTLDGHLADNRAIPVSQSEDSASIEFDIADKLRTWGQLLDICFISGPVWFLDRWPSHFRSHLSYQQASREAIPLLCKPIRRSLIHSRVRQEVLILRV